MRKRMLHTFSVYHGSRFWQDVLIVLLFLRTCKSRRQGVLSPAITSLIRSIGAVGLDARFTRGVDTAELVDIYGEWNDFHESTPLS